MKIVGRFEFEFPEPDEDSPESYQDGYQFGLQTALRRLIAYLEGVGLPGYWTDKVRLAFRAELEEDDDE